MITTKLTNTCDAVYADNSTKCKPLVPKLKNHNMTICYDFAQINLTGLAIYEARHFTAQKKNATYLIRFSTVCSLTLISEIK